MTVGPTQTSERVAAVARQAYDSSLALLSSSELRSVALTQMAQAIEEQQDDILEANTLDLEASREMAQPELLTEWLKLTPERLDAVVMIFKRLAETPDPTRQTLTPFYPVDRCQVYRQLMPLGVIALVYESLPELAAIAAGLCMRTGNALILKGGSEASHSNRAIVEILRQTLEDVNLPPNALQLLPTEQGDVLRSLVTQDRYINLVIPYGRASFVQQTIRQATVPTLKTAIGNCYLYWSPSGSLEQLQKILIDSHKTEPDPVNAIEKVLIHRSHSQVSLGLLWNVLREKGFKLRGDEELVQHFSELEPVDPANWGQAYLDNTIAFKIVDHAREAVAWMNQYSNGQANCIVTESYQESHQFATASTSALTYINSSPRFRRFAGNNHPIMLGMSSQKGHRRGPITLETLTTFKQVVQGNVIT